MPSGKSFLRYTADAMQYICFENAICVRFAHVRYDRNSFRVPQDISRIPSGIHIASRQSDDCLDMPWDIRVNKTVSIYADCSSSLVEQFRLSETVEWAALIIDRNGIISHNRNVSVGIHKPIKNPSALFQKCN